MTAGKYGVEGLMECIASCHFEFAGQQIFMRGRDHGRMGMLVRAGHPILAGHEQFFEPLVVDVEWDLPKT